MTLKEYVDNLNTGLTAFGLLKKPMPPEYMRRKINYIRRYIAQETRCLQCWNESTSADGVYKYQKPTDCLKILDVYYDDELLVRKNNSEMNGLLQDESVNIPEYWSEYGGENQPSGFIYLYPAPNTTGKIIKIQTIQLPVDLVVDGSVCELPLTMQFLVEEGVKIELLKDLGDRGYAMRQATYERKIKENINLRVR